MSSKSVSTVVGWDNTSVVEDFVHNQHLNKTDFFLAKEKGNRDMVKESLTTVDKIDKTNDIS